MFSIGIQIEVDMVDAADRVWSYLDPAHGQQAGLH